MVEVKEAVKVTSTHSKGAWVDRRVDLAAQYPLRPPFDRLPLLPRLSFDLVEVELYRGYPPSPHLPASAADSLRRAAGRGGAMAGGGLEFRCVFVLPGVLEFLRSQTSPRLGQPEKKLPGGG